MPRKSAIDHRRPKTKYVVPIVIERDANGYYAECPALQGCYTQGDTYEEVLSNIRDAIELHLRDRIENGEPIPMPEMVSVATLEVAT